MILSRTGLVDRMEASESRLASIIPDARTALVAFCVLAICYCDCPEASTRFLAIDSGESAFRHILCGAG
jgi:hypothetical protein